LCRMHLLQEHVKKHMAKLGLKKLCEALEQKYQGHAPRMELAEAFSLFDVNRDGMMSGTDMTHIMKECGFGGPKLKGLKVTHR
jgi:Ca2+-binding EF-hand superfamily protein